ncbi:MAG: beta-aspartyl-peptidase [Gammaproteobacteria bacterium]|nr:beta-aspartyl-peptidase [Gammaproteobacteria bacterium]
MAGSVNPNPIRILQMFELITNASVYAPEPLGIRHLLICAGKIAWIGEQVPQLDDSLEVEVTDLDGARLLPGFIDAHTHLTGGGGEAGPSTRAPSLALSQITRAGVTSVVGLLGTDDLTRTPQDLVTQAMGLREEGLSAWCYTGGYHVPVVTLTGSVRSDIVNLEPVIGVGEVALSDHRSSQPTRDEILRLASEAHVAGLMTGKAGIVHFHLGDGERGLAMIRECLELAEIPPRVFNPTHVNRNKPLFEEACELSGRGCNVDLTAFPADSSDEGWSAEDAVERYLEQGFDRGKLTISSDGGGCLPRFDAQGQLLKMGFASCQAMADCFTNLLARDLPLETILPFMTSNVAQLLKLPGKGRIARGGDADLVVVDRHNRIDGVMARGAWHVRDGRQLRSGLFEE